MTTVCGGSAKWFFVVCNFFRRSFYPVYNILTHTVPAEQSRRRAEFTFTASSATTFDRASRRVIKIYNKLEPKKKPSSESYKYIISCLQLIWFDLRKQMDNSNAPRRTASTRTRCNATSSTSAKTAWPRRNCALTG